MRRLFSPALRRAEPPRALRKRAGRPRERGTRSRRRRNRSAPERAREYLLLRLRTRQGIEEWEYRREFGLNFEPLNQRLEFFERYNWVEQTDLHRWRFTPEGFLLSNTLILDLLEIQASTLTEPKIWTDLLNSGRSSFESL